jgi:hypothetical protein
MDHGAEKQGVSISMKYGLLNFEYLMHGSFYNIFHVHYDLARA